MTDADQTPLPRIMMLNQAGQWVPAVDPLHFDKPGIVGVGLGRSFAVQLTAGDPDIIVGLIPCAVGGSPIDSWKPGEYYRPTKSHPWDDAIRRTKIALKHGDLKGILWHQGESDSKQGLSVTYENKLHDLVKRFRKELDAPDAPFIAGQMGRFPGVPWNEFKVEVDAAHRSLPQHVPQTAFIPADDLNHKGDKVHFDAASYRLLGKRYASAYLKMVTP